MQIEALKMFCDAVRLHSFTAAAKECRVTQSTISQTVQQLENHLGLKLIERTTRPWKLSSEGKVFYDGCRQIIERYCELEMQVKSFHDTLSAVVHVACIYSVGFRMMNQYCKQFSEICPLAKVQLEYMHPSRIYECVRNEDVDIGIVSFPQSDRHLEVIPWQSETMVLACRPDHELAKRKEIALNRIAGNRFVGLDRDLGIRREVDRYLRHNGVDVNVVLEFDNIEAIKRAIEAGLGISILPQPTLENELKTKMLAAVRLNPGDFKRPLGIIHLRGKRFSPNLQRFVDMLKSSAD